MLCGGNFSKNKYQSCPIVRCHISGPHKGSLTVKTAHNLKTNDR